MDGAKNDVVVKDIIETLDMQVRVGIHHGLGNGSDVEEQGHFKLKGIEEEQPLYRIVP